MADKDGPEEGWTTRGIEFGEAMGELLRLLEGVEIGVEVDDFPRAMYHASFEKTSQQTRNELKHKQEEATEREIQKGDDQDDNSPAEGTAWQQQTRARERERGDEGTQSSRQFPQSPRTRMPNPDSRAYGGWDVIDSMTVTQCDVRPPGMQTVEIIPNSLQEEWIEAWNKAHRQRQTVETEEEKEQVLKWILWLPKGLLHTPQR